MFYIPLFLVVTYFLNFNLKPLILKSKYSIINIFLNFNTLNIVIITNKCINLYPLKINYKNPILLFISNPFFLY